MSKHDLQKLQILVELRKAAHLTQDQAGALLGLEGAKRRDSVRAWESGTNYPALKRRSDFIVYLLDGLRLRNDPKRLRRVWDDIMVEEWSWRPLTEEELRRYLPGWSSLSRTMDSLTAGPAKGMDPLEEWISRLPVQKWVGRFIEDENGARTDLEKSAENLKIAHSSSEQSFERLADVLCGYTAFVELKEAAFPHLIEGVTAHIRERSKDQRAHDADETFDLLNRFTNWLYWRVRGSQSHGLFADLQKACALAWEIFMEEDPFRETVWFNRLFRAAVAINGPNCLDSKMLVMLERFLHETHTGFGSRDPLRATEFLAYYLEQLAHLWKTQSEPARSAHLLLRAGVESEEAAFLAVSSRNLQFATALHVRAGYCFEDTHKHKAAVSFGIAADILSVDNQRASIPAKRYYEKAFSLVHSSADGGPPKSKLESELEHKLERQDAMLAALDRTRRGTVAIITNEFDEVFADWLVTSFAEHKIDSAFLRPENVEELSQLTRTSSGYGGIVIVGGIRSHFTGRLLHEHFYMVPSRNKGLRFGDLDLQTRPYWDIWEEDLGECPVRILAGGNRRDTCRAVWEFIESGDGAFKDFVTKIL